MGGPLLRLVWYLVRVCALFSAYWLTGKWCLMMAIPPGYATAVWPPAGIALAGVLLWGYGIWPGVAAASFLLNFGTSFNPEDVDSFSTAVLVSTIIMIGASIQALVGAYLIKRWGYFPSRLEGKGDILGFLLLGGPVACVINATVGVLTLWLTGFISVENVLFSWWTWWVGDTTGVLVFAPLILLWAMSHRKRRLLRLLSITIPLVLCFGLAVGVFSYATQSENSRIRASFERQAASITDRIQRTIDDHIRAVQFLKKYIESDENVSSTQYHSFTEPILNDYPGILAVSYSPRIEQTARDAYEERESELRIQDMNASGDLVRAAQRLEYYPITELEPKTLKEQLRGYDIGTINLENPRGSKITAQGFFTSDVLQFPRIGRTDEALLIVYMPIYSASTTTSLHASLQGYVNAFISPTRVFEAALQHAYLRDVFIEIDAIGRDNSKHPFFHCCVTGHRVDKPLRTPTRARTPDLAHKATVSFGDSLWSVTVLVTPHYAVQHRSWHPWVVLGGSLALTVSVWGFLLILTGSSSRLRSENIQLEESKERLWSILGNVQQKSQLLDNKMFEALLKDMVSFTKSEYGLVGEVCHTQELSPFLRISSVQTFAWGRHLCDVLGEKMSGPYLEFHRMDTFITEPLKKGVIIVNDTKEIKALHALTTGALGIRSFVGIPISAREQVLGVVILANRTEGYRMEILKSLHPILQVVTHLLDSRRLAEMHEAEINPLSQYQRELSQTTQRLDGIVKQLRQSLTTLQYITATLTAEESQLSLEARQQLKLLEDEVRRIQKHLDSATHMNRLLKRVHPNR